LVHYELVFVRGFENIDKMNDKKLTLSSENKKLSGVCGGLAEYIGMDATVIRVLYVLATFFTGGILGILFYVLCAMIIPKKSV